MIVEKNQIAGVRVLNENRCLGCARIDDAELQEENITAGELGRQDRLAVCHDCGGRIHVGASPRGREQCRKQS